MTPLVAHTDEESGLETLLPPQQGRFLKALGLVTGAALLVSAGYVAGSRTVSFQADGLADEALLSASAWVEYYNSTIQSVSCLQVAQINKNIMAASTTIPTKGPNVPRQVNLHSWYNSEATTGKAPHDTTNKAMQAGLEQCGTATSPSKTKTMPSQVANCNSVISSAGFGYCLSKATAGHPWKYIVAVEAAIKGKDGKSLSGFGANVKALHDWYHSAAGASDRASFDTNAVSHAAQV